MKRQGSGWKGESRRHSLARKGVKTVLPDSRRFDVSKFVASGNKLPKIDIGRHYWSFKINADGTMKVSLGNMSDAGWYWRGDETDLGEFLYRLMNSKVKEQFINDMKDEGVTLEMLMPQLLESIEENDGGMYSLTGDNVRWRFGESFDPDLDSELDYLQDEYELSKADLKEIEDAYYIHMSGDNVNLDKFEETDTYAEIKKKFLHEVKTSYDFEDFDANMEALKEDVMYKMHDYDMQVFFDDFRESFNEWKKQKEEEGRVIKEIPRETSGKVSDDINKIFKKTDKHASKTAKVINKGLDKIDESAIKTAKYFNKATKGKASGVIADVNKTKRNLINKARKKGIYENFGQNEIMRLKDKYSDYQYGNMEQRKQWQKIEQLDDWAMNYTGR